MGLFTRKAAAPTAAATLEAARADLLRAQERRAAALAAVAKASDAIQAAGAALTAIQAPARPLAARLAAMRAECRLGKVTADALAEWETNNGPALAAERATVTAAAEKRDELAAELEILARAKAGAEATLADVGILESEREAFFAAMVADRCGRYLEAAQTLADVLSELRALDGIARAQLSATRVGPHGDAHEPHDGFALPALDDRGALMPVRLPLFIGVDRDALETINARLTGPQDTDFEAAHAAIAAAGYVLLSASERVVRSTASGEQVAIHVSPAPVPGVIHW